MNTDNINPQPEQNEKHSGGWHIFLFMGVAVVALVVIKFLIDNLMN